MKPLTKLSVGSPLPIVNPLPHHDGVYAYVNGASFDLIYWARNPSTDEIKTWTKGKLSYGVFVRNHIPFFLVDFNNSS